MHMLMHMPVHTSVHTSVHAGTHVYTHVYAPYVYAHPYMCLYTCISHGDNAIGRYCGDESVLGWMQAYIRTMWLAHVHYTLSTQHMHG